MMKLKRLGSLALSGTLMFATSCGDDEIAAATGDTMTVAEFTQMASAYSNVGAIMFQAFLDETLGAGRAGGIAAQSSQTFSTTVECPDGGTTTVSGSITPTGQSTATVQVTHTMADCGMASDTDQIWVFNSDPNVRWTANVTVNEEDDYSFTTTQTGRFGWSITDPQKDGGCNVSINFAVEGNFTVGNFTATLTGSVCGVSFEELFANNPA